MPPDTLVTVPGSGAAPLTYQIAPAMEVILKAAFAQFDGSGSAAAWLPCLRILSPSNQIVGEFITDASVAAAGSAEVSFAPFLDRGSGGGSGSGIQFGVEPQSGTWLEIETTSTDPSHSRGMYVQTTRGAEFAVVDTTTPFVALVATMSGTAQRDKTAFSAAADYTGSTGIATNNIGVRAEASGKTIVNYGVYGIGDTSDTNATSLAHGVFGDGFSRSAAWASGARLRGNTQTGGTAPVFGAWMTAVNGGGTGKLIGYVSGIVGPGGTGGGSAPAMASHGSNYIAGYLFVNADNSVPVDGLVIDGTGANAGSFLIRAWAAGALVFTVDMAGNVNIPAASNYNKTL